MEAKLAFLHHNWMKWEEPVSQMLKAKAPSEGALGEVTGGRVAGERVKGRQKEEGAGDIRNVDAQCLVLFSPPRDLAGLLLAAQMAVFRMMNMTETQAHRILSSSLLWSKSPAEKRLVPQGIQK